METEIIKLKSKKDAADLIKDNQQVQATLQGMISEMESKKEAESNNVTVLEAKIVKLIQEKNENQKVKLKTWKKP